MYMKLSGKYTVINRMENYRNCTQLLLIKIYFIFHDVSLDALEAWISYIDDGILPNTTIKESLTNNSTDCL